MRAPPPRDQTHSRFVRLVRTPVVTLQTTAASATFADLTPGVVYNIEANVVGAAIEQNRTREAIFQSRNLEALGQLTGGVAHDFNNILTVITGTIEILGEAVKDPAILLFEAALGAGIKVFDEKSAVIFVAVAAACIGQPGAKQEFVVGAFTRNCS